MEFAEAVVRAAWDRQGGRCAKCGRWLVWTRRGRESVTGAWQPHHKNPAEQGGCDAPANCIIFCAGIADCHFREGHAGIDWTHYTPLDDSKLLFLHAGDEEARRIQRPAGKEKESLIRSFFGIAQTPRDNKGVCRKQERKPVESSGRCAGASGRKKGATDWGWPPAGDSLLLS